jgi:hypothetical protein
MSNNQGQVETPAKKDIETLKKGTLEFRIEHKFGDAAGDLGGINTLYGLDNATDIRFAFEYGLTNNLMIGRT